MSRTVSQQMLNKQIVSKEQLNEASNRQRMHGGRLGQNLVALGYISEDQLDSFFKRVRLPGSLARSVECTRQALVIVNDCCGESTWRIARSQTDALQTKPIQSQVPAGAGIE